MASNTGSVNSVNSKVLFHISWSTSLYFLFIALNRYVFKLTFVLIGVVQELVTIPLILTQFVICVWALYLVIRTGFDRMGYMLWAFIIALINSAAVIYSFI